MGQVWLQSALWIGLALVASIVSIRVAVSVALIEIMVGALAGNAIGLPLTEWVNFLAGFGAITQTFLAGAEIDPDVVRRRFRSALSIGVVGHPVSSIVDLVQRGGYDLLVVGFMGRSALYNRIIGGKTDRLVELAPCQVLVVK